MRIAVFHNHPSGGASRSLYELGRRLAARHSLDVYTLSTADECFLASREYACAVHIAPFWPARPRRLGFYLNDWQQYRDLQRLDGVSRQLARRIDAAGYDVVLASACRFMQSPALLAHLTTPSVYYCHEPPRRLVQVECRPDAGPLGPYQRLRAAWHRPAQALVAAALRRYDHRNVRAATIVLTNSRFTARLIQSHYGREPSVCYLGVDGRRFLPGRRHGAGYVLSVGALEHHKGFDFLIRALGRLPESHRPPLVIVANYANPGVHAYLLRLATRQGVTLMVRIGIDDAALLEAYQGASIFAYAPHGEPFGLAVLEAMACALPVVAVAQGGVMESVQDGATGYLVPRNEALLAEAISRLLGDEATARRLGQAGREVVQQRWTWEAAAERLERHLRQAACPGGRTVARG